MGRERKGMVKVAEYPEVTFENSPQEVELIIKKQDGC